MILVWGEQDDVPVARVIEELRALTAPVLHVTSADLGAIQFELSLGPRPDGWLNLRGRKIAIKDIRGFYLRPGATDSPAAARAAQALLGLAAFLPGVVLNRPAAGRSNHSKAYQLGLIAQAGFEVPDTLVTTDPDCALAFVREHGRLAYKALSGIRTIVATLGPGDEGRLDGVSAGPVQFQAYVDGLDVRVHVIGEQWFACAVRSAATDYRYAAAQGDSIELSELEIPPDVGRRIVEMVRGLGLRFAGVDLRLTPTEKWVCFEVNPSPGFPFYEDHTNHPIAATVANELISGKPSR